MESRLLYGSIVRIRGSDPPPFLEINMAVPKKFWEEEAHEIAHKDIKKELEKAAGKTKKKKLSPHKPRKLKKLKPREHAIIR
jgi:uncharacterized protein YdaU (DUF1376 family)